jgi:hypothetical protein
VRAGSKSSIGSIRVFDIVEQQESSRLIRAFQQAHKDVVNRLSGVDFSPMSADQADAEWERTERNVLLETNRKHDWEHRDSPWFRLYYHFY